MVEAPFPTDQSFPRALGLDVTVAEDGTAACPVEPWMADDRGHPLAGSLAMLAELALRAALYAAVPDRVPVRPLELRLQLTGATAPVAALRAGCRMTRIDGTAVRAEGQVTDGSGNVLADAVLRATTEPMGEVLPVVADRSGADARLVNVLGVDMPVELLSRSSAVASPAPPDPGLRPAISRLGAVVTSLGVTEAGLRVPPRSSILDPGGRPDPGALAMVADVATSLALRAATAGSQCRILDFSVSYRWPAAAVPGPLDAKASVVHRGLGTVVVSGDITGPTGLAVLVTTTSLVAEG